MTYLNDNQVKEFELEGYTQIQIHQIDKILKRKEESKFGTPFGDITIDITSSRSRIGKTWIMGIIYKALTEWNYKIAMSLENVDILNGVLTSLHRATISHEINKPRANIILNMKENK